eukprot:752819-Hanusia_phi.AAC.8
MSLLSICKEEVREHKAREEKREKQVLCPGILQQHILPAATRSDWSPGMTAQRRSEPRDRRAGRRS